MLNFATTKIKGSAPFFLDKRQMSKPVQLQGKIDSIS
jgi:hypothetical protein